MAITSSNDIYLDFTSKDMVTIQCCQYDIDSRTYIIHLMDKGKEFTLNNNKHQLKFKQAKKDGTVIFNDVCTVNPDGTATYTLTEQSCVFAGVHDIQFVLLDMTNEEVINTIPAKLNVTKSVVDNVKIESSNEYSALTNLLFKAEGIFETLKSHIKNLSNPHKVTKEQVGLENVDNTSDIDKPVSKAQQAAIDDTVKNYLPLSGGEISDDENTLEIYPNRIIGSSDSFISGFNEIHANLFEGDLNGNATTAKGLETERTIELTGSVTGNGTFDGSGDLIIETTTNHTHDYLPLTGGGTIRDDDGDRITISPISIVGDTNSYIDGFYEIGASSFKEDGKYLKDKYADKSHTHAISEIDEAVTGIKGNAETSYRTGNVNLTAENVGALSLANGGTVTGTTVFQGKRRVHHVDDGSGKDGYDKIARFTANTGYSYNNASIEIELARRTDTVPTRIAIMFAGNACYVVSCMGHTKDVYMCKESDGVWVLYVKKTHNWCTTDVLDYVHSSFADGVDVEWIVEDWYAESLPDTQVISGQWGYIVNDAINANNVAWEGITGKPSLYPPSDGSGYYVKNENLSDIDLNNVTTTGIYHLTGNLTNIPLSAHATLFVDFNVSTPYQIFIPDYAYVMYKRTYSNSSWGGWVCLNDYIPISGTSSLAGSIIPNEDVAMDLGDSTHRFTHVYSRNVTTGAIWMEHNSNAIYESGNDAANGNGGGLNNLVIRSWWGVSFTSNCVGGRYSGKNQTAVGIDCREGIVKAYDFQGLINGHSVNADVPSNAKFTDTLYTLPTATSSVTGGVKLSDSINDISGTGQGVAATPYAVEKVVELVNDLKDNIQQSDVIANISSSSSTYVIKSIPTVSADYREYVVVLCNGDEFDHTVINTYTWLSSMVNGYYELHLYDPSNNRSVGYIEFQTNSIYVSLNKYDEYYIDIYGLISL